MPHPSTPAVVRPSWLPAERWPFTLRTFHAGDHPPVHYLDEGSGPTLVFIHAGMWSFIWRDLISELSADHRCLTLDFPGAGLSGGDGSDVDLGSFVGIATRWLDHLQIDDATMVVHDLGGVVGVNVAAADPGRINGLIAINSFAWPAEGRSLKTMLAVMGHPLATATLGTVGLVPRLTRTGSGVGRNLDGDDRRAFYGPYRDGSRRRNFHRAMRSAVRSSDLYQASDRALGTSLAHLPAMTVFGEKNDPFGFGDEWRRRFPDVEAHIIEGGNHFPMCDEPELVAGWIRAWRQARVPVA